MSEGVSFSTGAALGVPYSAAYGALFQRAYAVPADILLIHGADGSVGMAAMQFARARGITTIATVEGRRVARWLNGMAPATSSVTATAIICSRCSHSRTAAAST